MDIELNPLPNKWRIAKTNVRCLTPLLRREHLIPLNQFECLTPIDVHYSISDVDNIAWGPDIGRQD